MQWVNMGFFDFIKSLFEVRPSESKNHSDDDLDDEGNTVFTFGLDYPRSWEISKCEINSPVHLWWPPKDRERFCIVYRTSKSEQGGQMGVVPKEFLGRLYDPLDFEYSAKVAYIGPSAKSCTIECTIYNKAATRARWQEEKKQKAKKLKPLLSKPYRPKKDITITLDAHKDKVKLFKRGLKLYLKEKTLEEYLEEPDHLAIIFCDNKGEDVASKIRVPKHVRSIIRAQLSGHDIDFEVVEMTEYGRSYTASEHEEYGLPYEFYVKVTYHLN